MFRVQTLLFITISLLLSACSSNTKLNAMEKKYKEYGASFSDVWSEVVSDPYVKLPQKEVSYKNSL
ncbi:MAG: hypothetical protein Q9M40_13290 [Sulfurimonas sp.]|nr:hypothetical protein [Sulfurimonas sp.]